MRGRGHRVSDTLLDLSGSVHCSMSDFIGDVVHKLLPDGNGIALADLLGHREALPPCKLTPYHVFLDLLQRNFRPLVLPRPKKRGYHPCEVHMEVCVFLLVVVPSLVGSSSR